MKTHQICRVALLTLGLLVQSSVWAHGYTTQPASRSILCKQGANINCGSVQYEPQSLEQKSGFPNGGPIDGRIASADLVQFGNLDEQSSSRWTKRNISAGAQNFTWTLTAAHRTRGYRYYMTKQDWNPNAPLTRASFDLQPFCNVDAGNLQPPFVVTHSCNVPARSGYQIILSVWEIGDTINSFYNVADVMFSGTNPNPNPGPDPVDNYVSRGTINPSVDLQAGDKVMTRVFNANGEQNALRTVITIGNATEGLRNNWSYALATRINAEQASLRAGQLGSNGKISPVFGSNEVFSFSKSGIARVETAIEKAPVINSNDVLVGGLSNSYPIVNGQATVVLTATAVGEMDIAAYLYDAKGTSKGFAATTSTLNNSGVQLRIAVNQPVAGNYQLVVKGTVKGSGQIIQKTFNVALTGGTVIIDPPPPAGGAQYVFPNGLASYKAGTLVQQPKNGKIYECKPWPYSGYCSQWNTGATQFEPGFGSSWSLAWIER
jgi:N-acetylglucosamine-binding protein A